MKRPLTSRQKAYRKYLLTDHWKNLKQQALGRDKNTCQQCGSDEKVEVHHLRYRGSLYDTQLEDLKSLCRICHRIEHGLTVYWPFDWKLKELDSLMSRNVLPTDEQLVELASMIFCEEQAEQARALIRSRAGFRIILTSSKMWSSWLKKPKEVPLRLWPWASKKLKQFQALADS